MFRRVHHTSSFYIRVYTYLAYHGMEICRFCLFQIIRFLCHGYCQPIIIIQLGNSTPCCLGPKKESASRNPAVRPFVPSQRKTKKPEIV